MCELLSEIFCLITLLLTERNNSLRHKYIRLNYRYVLLTIHLPSFAVRSTIILYRNHPNNLILLNQITIARIAINFRVRFFSSSEIGQFSIFTVTVFYVDLL